MRQVVEAILTPITRTAVAHPVPTTLLLVPTATGLTIAAFVGDAHPLQYVLLALLWLAIIALLFGIRVRRRHEQAVQMAESVAGVVPPPPYVAGSGFWIGVFFALAMLGAIGAFWNDVGVPGGHVVTDAVVTHTEVTDARGTFHDTFVNFVVEERIVSTSFVRYGRVAAGETVTIHYASDNPTVVEEAAPNERYLIAGGFGFFAALGLVLAFITRPRPVDPAASLARVPGARTWRQRTTFDNGSQHEEHLWFSDGETLRMWTTGSWTLNAIERWLETGGTPSPQAHSSIAIPIVSIDKIDVARRKLRVHHRKNNGRTKTTSIELNDPEALVTQISAVHQWHHANAVATPTSAITAGLV